MSEETLADRIKAIRMAARDNLSEAGKKVLLGIRNSWLMPTVLSAV